MPVAWLEGFTHRHVTNRAFPRRAQLGRPHSKSVDTILLHSTEGSSVHGAFGEYDRRAGLISGGVHPHLTVDPTSRERFQHVPLTKASYALKRGDADGIIQIEIVGFADRGWGTSDLLWLGSEVIAPIRRAIPTIPLYAPAEFLGKEAGLLAAPWPRGRARLSPTQWAGVSGIVGHQHAPHDNHWDPGAIDIDAVIRAAAVAAHPSTRPIPSPPVVGGFTEETDHMVIANTFGSWRLLLLPTGFCIATNSSGTARTPDATVDKRAWDTIVSDYENRGRLLRAG